MDPISLGLIGLSAVGKIGSLFGQKKRKTIDPNELRQLFGAKAVTDEQMELFNRALSSAQGQQMMAGAAESGQNFQTDVARQTAMSGEGGGEGMQTGRAIFGNAAASQAAGNLQRTMQGNLMQSMLPIAQQLVSDRMQAWLADRNAALGQTTRFQDIMGSIGELGGDLLASRQMELDRKSVSTSGADNKVTQGADPNQPAQPSGAAPQAAMSPAGPAGAAAVTGAPQAGQPAMAQQLANVNMPLSRRRANMNLLGNGGRFARAMSANRFGAVQQPFSAVA